MSSLPQCNSVQITVQLFAAVREVVGLDAIVLETHVGATVGDLRKAMMVAVPATRTLSGALLWAVNNSYAGDSQVIAAIDSVACFPPVSGG